MKKLILLALGVLLIPGLVVAGTPTREGNGVFHSGYRFPDHFGGSTWPVTAYVIAGEAWTDWLVGINHSLGTTCNQTDTFCFSVTQTLAWSIPYTTTGNHILECATGIWYEYLDFTVNVPCSVSPGDVNTVTFVHAYANDDTCDASINSCSASVNSKQRVVLNFEVVASPPALYILQDTLYLIEQGQTAAYVPFSICNGDPCSPPINFNYTITSLGTVGDPLNENGVVAPNGGECADVYGIVDAGDADVCDFDWLTIVVWTDGGTTYDTCVQKIHVVTPVPVPLFTAPVVTILVLAMILAAAVIMKRHAVSKA
jgi:hypothetical protein